MLVLDYIDKMQPLPLINPWIRSMTLRVITADRYDTHHCILYDIGMVIFLYLQHLCWKASSELYIRKMLNWNSGSF